MKSICHRTGDKRHKRKDKQMIQPIEEMRVEDLDGQTILMRVDFNCPLAHGKVSDATRIDRIMPSIQLLLEKGAAIILLSHLGRPKGKIVPEMSLAPICSYIEENYQLSVPLITQLDRLESPAAGTLVMAENLRFSPEEEANDERFAAKLASAGDIYVNDAFSCAHRAHASTHALAALLPAYAGPALMREVRALKTALETPKRPVVAVVGGAKISTKLDVLTHLISRVDHLILGGGMANTFLAAKGYDMALSLMEADLVDTAKEILSRANAQSCTIHLPADGQAAREFKEDAPSRTILNEALAEDEMMLDIGPKAIADYSAVIAGAKCVLWNGPMGAFEIPPFDMGTSALANIVARATASGELVSIAGGGDTVAALNHAGCADAFSYVSLAGGAFLEWIEGRELPGIAILDRDT